jgi:purine nucleosidase
MTSRLLRIPACLFCLTGMVLLTVGAAMAQGEEKIKVIFDTDLGGDIDDAFAHALVQISPELEVLGITTASGPTDLRAKVGCRMLYLCGQEDIPIAVGRATGRGKSPQLNWGDGFDRVRPIDLPAADFIIQNLRKYPHQVTVISVGPVTNLGDVIDKDPEAWKLVKAVYSMFGSFYMGYAEGSPPTNEYNVRADVESAQKFIGSGVPITLAGLDVTTMVKFQEERRLQLLLRQSPLTDSLCGLYSLWSMDRPGRPPTLYDPVAVAMVFTDQFVEIAPAHVRVTDDGHTVVEKDRPPNCRIGTRIDKDAFLDWLTKRLLTQNLMRPDQR